MARFLLNAGMLVLFSGGLLRSIAVDDSMLIIVVWLLAVVMQAFSTVMTYDSWRS
jgi:hypothetical protein